MPSAPSRLPDLLTFGIEEEFLIVDRDTGALVPRRRELIAATESESGEIEPELNLCQIEIATPICTRADEARASLLELRRSIDAAAESMGLAVVALGSHPFSGWRSQQVDTETERYADMSEEYAIVAKEQVICGCHVHVGVDDADQIIRVMARLRRWLPPLLALSANSPFWGGEDSGYASYRTQVWQRWPTSGMPPALADRAEYEALVEDLVASGALVDTSYLYWYARPSRSYPTIEIRIGDVMMSAGETVALGALLRALVWRAICEDRDGSPFNPHRDQVLDAAVWRASRHGITELLVGPTTGEPTGARAVIEETIEYAAPGLRVADDEELVREAVERWFSGGTGADRQRHLARGVGGHRRVVDAAVDHFTR